MRGSLRTAVAFSVAVAFTGASRADDQANAVVDKAIKATYVNPKATAAKAMIWKSKGKVHVMGMEIAYTGTFYLQPPAQIKTVIDADVAGMKLTIVTVFDGDKAWRSLAGQTEELDAEALKEVKEGFYVQGLTSLLPLKTPGLMLSLAGETKVGDRDAVGIKVSAKDHRDATLYFDKKTNLLVKHQTRSKDDMSGQEFNQETIYLEHKEIHGVKHGVKQQIKRDGELFLEGENYDFEQLDKLDANIFAKP